MAANWARTRRRTYPVTGMLRLLTTKKRRGIGGRSNVFLSILLFFVSGLLLCILTFPDSEYEYYLDHDTCESGDK